jgi:hypothetical protein
VFCGSIGDDAYGRYIRQSFRSLQDAAASRPHPHHTDPDARRADVGAALELARRQGAALFELRAALDDFEPRGEPARAALIDAASRIPTNNAWPELARAEAILAEDSPRI